LDLEGKALARAIGEALKDAGSQPHEVDHVLAHGVSLEMYDRSETNAIKKALGEHAYRVPVTAVKSMTGQPYAAGGLLGAATGILSLDRGVVAPTINLETPDPECDLDYVAQRARRNDVQTALVIGMSFGGTYCASVLRKAA
jgi:3-oxoacyl-[acyl-carrier-protein] synthase II